ncbi:MAG: glycosyltransferase [Anaerolineae bacterium]|nr:glycosyltransferase [Anaerolineae bacterium]MCO5187157.1 glycosyltransferase [Anaerolineae bacterium]MCO5207399.1 glycosyltransferase [Anaerolineae bacterium]
MIDCSALRISFVAGTLGQGGAERQLYYMVRALINHVEAIQIVSLTDGGYWAQPLRNLGAEVVFVHPFRPRLARVRNLIIAVKHFRPHIVQSQHFFVNGYAAMGALASGAFALGAIRGNGAYDFESAGFVGARLGLWLPRLLVANSQAAIDYLYNSRLINSRKALLLPNVVDVEQFQPSTNVLTVESHIRILAVGRLVQLKGFDMLLRAVDQFRKASSLTPCLFIVGDGPRRANLIKLADSLGLMPDTVRFCGETSDVASYYERADVFVLSSLHEGTPNVVLEAMAAGLPVIATRVGDLPDIITHEHNGLLVDVGDVDGMLASIRRLAEDSDLRKLLGRRARRTVETRFSHQALFPNLVSIYERLLDSSFDK